MFGHSEEQNEKLVILSTLQDADAHDGNFRAQARAVNKIKSSPKIKKLSPILQRQFSASEEK